MISANITAVNTIGFDRIGWRYYNKIKKKAMEQEFSWSGLLISLSIAFFIVISTACILRLMLISIEKIDMRERLMNKYNIQIISESRTQMELVKINVG
jgi:hypothetical protein